MSIDEDHVFEKHENKRKRKIAVVIPARNEEQNISKTLQLLLNQDLLPHRIIVVNDGSTDKTAEIVSNFKTVEIVNREKRDDNLVAKKELAITINLGLSRLADEKDCDFIMILGADQCLPKEYLNKITRRMISNPKIVIASGCIEGEFSEVPRGGGRVVRFDFWKKLGLAYPVNYLFEGYLILKAQSLGYALGYYTDLIMKTQRKTGSTYYPKLYYYYGIGLKALGFTLPSVFFALISLGKKSPRAAYHLFRGFFSNYDDLYEPELRFYVRKRQRNNLRHLRTKILGPFMKM